MHKWCRGGMKRAVGGQTKPIMDIKASYNKLQSKQRKGLTAIRHTLEQEANAAASEKGCDAQTLILCSFHTASCAAAKHKTRWRIAEAPKAQRWEVPR